MQTSSELLSTYQIDLNDSIREKLLNKKNKLKISFYLFPHSLFAFDKIHFIRFNLKQLLVLIRNHQEIKKRKIELFSWQEGYTKIVGCRKLEFFSACIFESISNCLFLRANKMPN